jgi:threonyl-tRNA synthetase
VEVDKSNETLNKKVRNAELKQWNYILVAGEEEVKTGTVDVRSKEGTQEKRMGKKRVDEVVKYFDSLMTPKSKSYKELYAKAWKPEDYPVVAHAEEHPVVAKVEEQK